ncbi:uncharacterized protein LOC117325896 [Pecten maximus]|uniref:uncharacterized protein LOC117325896 n=1 Tax=Pecten maximus TaxID=6579 RepID=UPI001458D775|nr:uncharacterized protein LOC117325896 [Pecten maximus]
MAGDIKNLSPKSHVIIAIFMFIAYQNNFRFGVETVEIAAKVELLGECLDYSNNTMADLEETKSSATACDAKICHKKASGNYFVTLSCHPDVINLVDPANCQLTEDTGANFPDCCPKVTCGTGSAPSTVDPTSCYDLHTTRSCDIWSDLTNSCTDYSVFAIQNYTTVYCRQTCGICSSG